LRDSGTATLYYGVPLADYNDKSRSTFRKSMDSKKSKRKSKKKDTLAGSGTWDERIGLPISTYNEKVHPSFRVNFNQL
jgi:hypothetical protein